MEGYKYKNESSPRTLQEEGESVIKWSNLIFLPFNPVFQTIVLLCVIVKCTLGPLQSLYLIGSDELKDANAIINFLFIFHWYIVDTIYGIDTILHIIHRQVTDKAMRREYLPKAAILLFLDIVALIPFFRLLSKGEVECIRIWPNILAFNEFLVVYRICEYFELIATHSYSSLIIGLCLIMPITLNSLAAFWILLTYEEVCLNQSSIETVTYVSAYVFVSNHGLRRILNDISLSTIFEFLASCLLMITGYTVSNVLVLSKAFSESLYRLKRICAKYPEVKKIIEETKRRNPSHRAYLHVDTYYTTMWRRRSGIVHMPDILEDIPRYLRLAIKQDLFWPLFYHSPILRNCSWAFKRFLCENVNISYKLPGERFHAGSQCMTNLYYVKSGVVQIVSGDDGTTPILSVTSGTIFGDIHFLLPYPRTKFTVRCLTYCEVLHLTRYHILKALHKFPEDSKNILCSYFDRINHAKKLHSCKEQMQCVDNNEDKSIAWIKMRWWQIFEVVSTWKKLSLEREFEQQSVKCQIPPEDSPYHCAKYLGQLVLCTDVQLQTKSMFVNYSFPWIISPYSILISIWKKNVICTVLLALCIYPFHITTKGDLPICEQITSWIDFIYLADLYISLTTAVTIQENETPNFGTILFERCKSLNFIMDILSTITTEYIVVITKKPSLYYPLQFNRLIKIHVFFSTHYMKWDIKKSPLVAILRNIILIHICFVIITSHLVYEIGYYYPELTMSYFFGNKFCTWDVHAQCKELPVIGIVTHWIFEFIFPSQLPKHHYDVIISIIITFTAYILYAYCKGNFFAYLYLKYQGAKDYQYFVLNVKNYFSNSGISIELLKRLQKYLVCHFKYYKGINEMDRDSYKHEPFDIYWKVQGEIAQKIIGESRAFTHADPSFIRELARSSKYIIMPKNAYVFLFGSTCNNVIWIVQGYVTSDFNGPHGVMQRRYYKHGDMISISPVLFGKYAIRTYTCYTVCEILYINSKEFFQIYKRYPHEWQYFETVLNNFHTEIEDVYEKEVIRQKENLKTHKFSVLPVVKRHRNYREFLKQNIWQEPESKFMQIWLLFRAIVVVVSIVNASLLGSIGATSLLTFRIIGWLCDTVAIIDMILKLFIAYYDNRGLMITDKRKCLKNYLTKGFLMDVIGAVPMFEILPHVSTSIEPNEAMLINTCCKFAHLYIVLVYFDYIGDLPTTNDNAMIMKWQVVNILMALGASPFFMSQCVDYEFNKAMELNNILYRNVCWMPEVFNFTENLDKSSLYLIFAQSLHLAENGMLLVNHGAFMLQNSTYVMWFVLFVFGIIFWCITCYTLTLLVLASRENRMFQYGVDSLETFLQNERVEKQTINKAIEHFRYCWMRTKGVNIQQMLKKRIGVVLGQDLSYACFKTTYAVLNTLLKGEETMQRQLASFSSVTFFLPGHEIMREMDLVPDIFVVHRGRVVLKKNGRKIITLTKGDIFGQLRGRNLRPMSISAEAHTHTDVMQISVKNFQEVITDEVRKTIAKNVQSRSNFLASKTWYEENPYDSIEYILRARITLQLPWMHGPLKVHHRSIYAWWLYMTWLCGPCITSCIVVLLPWSALSLTCVRALYIILIVLDVLHVSNFVAKYYSIFWPTVWPKYLKKIRMTTIVIENNKCVRRIIGFGILKEWKFYVDVVSILVPLLSFVKNDPRYQFAKLLRLNWLMDFNHHFCQGFKTKAAPRALKVAIVFLLLHMFTCGWIYVACSDEKFSYQVPQFNETMIDLTEWSHPNNRKGGCARITKKIIDTSGIDGKLVPGLAVPVFWLHDYIIAFTFILLIQTHTSLNTVMAITTSQVYYKMVITYAMYLIEMWLLALAVSAIYTRLRDFYQLDYQVLNLTTFLKDSGLCPSLLHDLHKYVDHLWRKHTGNWLPQIAYDAPVCLREDLFVALYIHHLNTPVSFRQLPHYFKRQLAARLQRTVILPGKYIVQEGDVLNVTFFIHEGEVEKWHNNSAGEGQFLSLLYTNGYFGCIPGLFANSAFQFSYLTRTVVDLVYLRLENWKDLLDAYPDIKNNFCEATRLMKQEATKVVHGK